MFASFRRSNQMRLTNITSLPPFAQSFLRQHFAGLTYLYINSSLYRTSPRLSSCEFCSCIDPKYHRRRNLYDRVILYYPDSSGSEEREKYECDKRIVLLVTLGITGPIVIRITSMATVSVPHF